MTPCERLRTLFDIEQSILTSSEMLTPVEVA